jgi:hypothetical protein
MHQVRLVRKRVKKQQKRVPLMAIQQRKYLRAVQTALVRDALPLHKLNFRMKAISFSLEREEIVLARYAFSSEIMAAVF